MTQAGGGVMGGLDVRSMGDDSIVVIEEGEGANSAWPPWKHLLEVRITFFEGFLEGGAGLPCWV